MLIKKEKILKKHNAAIRSYSEMSLLERKIANALLYNAYHNLLVNNFHEISVTELLNLLSMKTNDYDKIKQVIRQLMTTVIEWNVTKKERESDVFQDGKLFNTKENWRACTLLSSVHIIGTQIKYEYSQTLRELLYKPSLYSKISLSIQSKFKSAYSLSLYENCLSYLNCGSTGWLDILSFRKLMGVHSEQYKIFRDFNKRVLRPAVLEINKVSNIVVDYEIKKINQAVSHIKLRISNKKLELQKPPLEINENILTNTLKQYGFSERQAILLSSQYKEGYILDKISLLNESNTEIKNPMAFLKAALEGDYQKSKSLPSLKRKESKEEYLKKKWEEDENILSKENYGKYVDALIMNYLSTIGREERILLRKELNEHGQKLAPWWNKVKIEADDPDWANSEGTYTVFRLFKIYVVAHKNKPFTLTKFPKIMDYEEYKNDLAFSLQT